MSRTVVCFSGGIDSTITAALLKQNGSEVFPLFFEYNQPELKQELGAAKTLSTFLCMQPLKILKLNTWNTLIENFSNQSKSNSMAKRVLYLPFRNFEFSINALIYAHEIQASSVAFGFIADTLTSAYNDAKPEFLSAFNNIIASFEARLNIEVIAPYVNLKKSDLILAGIDLNIPLKFTYSCWKGGTRCGVCDSCQQTILAFAEAEIRGGDMTAFNPYRKRSRSNE